jgi:integrase
MSKRRANGEGNVYERGNGRWEARMSYTHPDTGTRKRISVYALSRKAALDKLDEARDRIEAGAPPKDDTSRSVGQWLTHWRQTTLAVSDRKESTRQLYANLSRKHLESGSFADIRLDRLRPSNIEALVLDMRSRTKQVTPTDDKPDHEPVRALSDSTIRSTYTVLRSALDGAVRDGLLARNPAAQVKRPGVERREAKHLDANAVSAVLRAAEGSRYYPALVMIASTGLRRGEALALRWDSDVLNLDEGWLKVRRTLARIGDRLVISEPKTDRARRTVPLTPAVVKILKAHRKSQLQERLRAANKWADTGLVFTTALGTPVDPRSFLRVVEVAAAKAGIDGVDLHMLRHSAAVAWLEAGVHIKAVADLLGHSSIAVTGDIYGHTSDDAAKAAVLALGARLNL